MNSGFDPGNKRLFFLLIILLLGVSTFLFYRWDRRIGDSRRIRISDRLESRVEVLRKYKGLVYILTSDSDRYVIDAYYNDMFEPTRVAECIFSGDSLSKRSGSDTIFIYRRSNFLEKGYFFLLKME